MTEVWCIAVSMQNVGFAGVQGVPLDRTVAQASSYAALK